ncbi:MAG: hypothetical protein ACI9HE_003755 [Planctomycetota bacterium]|jgi:hypothetical protein
MQLEYAVHVLANALLAAGCAYEEGPGPCDRTIRAPLNPNQTMLLERIGDPDPSLGDVFHTTVAIS